MCLAYTGSNKRVLYTDCEKITSFVELAHEWRILLTQARKFLS